MARLGARYQHFFAKGKIYKHFWMSTETAAQNASASGTILTPSASVIAGAPSGSVQVAGFEFVEVASSIDAGVAAGSATINGETATIATAIVPGVASVDDIPIRMVGGSAVIRSPHVARGDVVAASVSIIPGTVQIGHEVSLNKADGTSEVLTIFGATDGELRDPAFMLGIVYDDWDLYLMQQRREAA